MFVTDKRDGSLSVLLMAGPLPGKLVHDGFRPPVGADGSTPQEACQLMNHKPVWSLFQNRLTQRPCNSLFRTMYVSDCNSTRIFASVPESVAEGSCIFVWASSCSPALRTARGSEKRAATSESPLFKVDVARRDQRLHDSPPAALIDAKGESNCMSSGKRTDVCVDAI